MVVRRRAAVARADEELRVVDNHITDRRVADARLDDVEEGVVRTHTIPSYLFEDVGGSFYVLLLFALRFCYSRFVGGPRHGLP